MQTLLTSPSIKVFDPPPPVPPAQRNWGRDVRGGLIPIGTTSVAVEVVSDIAAANHDGFVDLVDFRVRNAMELRMYLEVNTTTGRISIKNETNATISIDYYEITSASNALNESEWTSLQEQDLAGFPPGNGSGNGWEQFGGSDAGVIGESYLAGNSSLANSESLGLGPAFIVGGERDLVFHYGALTTTARVTGDYNNDGTVNAADYVIWRDKLDQNATLPNDSTPGTVTQADYDVWRTNFGRMGAPTGPSTLITGFVRYVNGDLINGAVVPEQASVCIVGIGLGTLLIVTRRRSSEF